MSSADSPLKLLFTKYKNAFRAAWDSRHAEDRRQRYLSIESDFLPASLAISERPTPILPRVALWLIVAFIIIGILWSVIGKVDVIVVAAGKVLASGKTKPIQSVETQVVRKVLVKEGQSVGIGDILLEMDPVSSEADLNRYKEEITRNEALKTAYTILLERMKNSINRNKIPISVDGKTVISNASPDAKSFIQSIVTIRWEEYQSKLQRAVSELYRRNAENDTFSASLKTLNTKLQYEQKVERDYFYMFNSKVISEHAWMERKSKVDDIIGEISRTNAQLEQSQHAAIQAKKEIELIHASEKTSWTERLNEAEKDLNNVTAEYNKATYRADIAVLRAPVSGVVQQLSVTAPGAVVTAGQAIMAIVPAGNLEDLEVQVENKDIAFVRLGQETAVKVEAFDYTRYGTLPAKVVYISEDAVADDKGVLRYIARLRLEKKTFEIEGKTRTLAPGMNVVADIKAGRRSIIAYFLSPIIKSTSEAIHER